MKSMKLIFMLAVGYFYQVAAWSHDDTNWAGEFPQCGGSRQSPIDIMLSSLKPGYFSTNLKIRDLNKQPAAIELRNDGHTANAVYNWTGSVPTMSGGPLKNIYNFLSLHWHWGPNNSVGSEHLVNGRATPLEIHLIFQNTKYASLEEALGFSDGLSVLGIRYHCEPRGRRYKLFEYVKNIPGYQDTFRDIRPNVPRINEVLGNTNFHYAYYEGSLTTPPCSEAVQWIVNLKTVPMDCSQLDYFRAMRDENGNNILKNYRPVQPLNNRKVLKCST